MRPSTQRVDGNRVTWRQVDDWRLRLLPAFDQYVVTATRHADRLLPAASKERVYRTQGWLSPVLLVDAWPACGGTSALAPACA